MRVYTYKPSKNSSSNSTVSLRKTRKKFNFKLPKFNSKRFWTWVFRTFAVGVVFAALLFLFYAHDLPDPNKLLERQVPESTKIMAKDGSLLYEIHGEYKRTQVELDAISNDLKNATIAIEDKDFYKHGGISLTGILRAIIVDIKTGEYSQGGSTITQQFVKKSMLTDDKSPDRKIREIILAIAIDSRFDKNEILKLYLNEIPYGRNAYGIEAASKTYFSKSAKDLTLAESAYLAALPQRPSYFNPYGSHFDALEARKNAVLTAMQDQGYITADQAKAAKEEKVVFAELTSGIKAPHFVLWVQEYLADKFGEKTLEEGGLQIYTTLDPKLQQIAEEAVKTGAEKNATKYGAGNAALVAIDPKNGQILAMVGSKDYFGDPQPEGCRPGRDCAFEGNVNVAISQRQPGSSFKPYVYVTAFKKDFGYSPASLLVDVLTNFGTYNGKDYIPNNYNGQVNGPLSMRQSLAGSLNIPAVKTLDLVGVSNAVQTAHDLGITSPLQDCGLSLVLGGCEVRLLDHVAAYSAIANLGVKNQQTPILKILDKDGSVLEEFKENPQTVLDPQAAYELISIMTDNNARSFVFGPNSPLILPDRVVAAKTGTTNDWGDGWTMGFTPSLAAGVWAGNNCGGTKCPMKRGADGVLVAAPIWNEFMKKALAGTPAEQFTVPSGIQQITVDSLSGKLPTDASPSTKVETFADYSAPTDYDNIHIKAAIDSATGLPATSLTPQNQITYKVYTALHSEKPQNPNWETPVQQWALSHGYEYPPGDANIIQPGTVTGNQQSINVNITNPNNGATITQTPFQVNVSASSPNLVTKADLSIDGELYQTVSSQPFTFNMNKNLADGSHTLAVRVTDSQGQSADTSITITIQKNAPLTLTEPTGNSLVLFPLTLTAESSNEYPGVNFYYQNDKGQAKLIGAAANNDHLGSTFRYGLVWQTPPASGTYKVYAQTSNGTVTKKVNISVP